MDNEDGGRQPGGGGDNDERGAQALPAIESLDDYRRYGLRHANEGKLTSSQLVHGVGQNSLHDVGVHGSCPFQSLQHPRYNFLRTIQLMINMEVNSMV